MEISWGSFLLGAVANGVVCFLLGGMFGVLGQRAKQAEQLGPLNLQRLGLLKMPLKEGQSFGATISCWIDNNDDNGDDDDDDDEHSFYAPPSPSMSRR